MHKGWDKTAKKTRNMSKLKILNTVIIALLSSIYITLPVLAATPLTSPESVEVVDIRVFRHLAETDDMLYVIQYDIAIISDNYSAMTTPASDSYLFRLVDTDGETILATTVPYVYSFFESNGYGDGVSAFYFAAADDKPDWGDAVTIELYGSPTYFNPASAAYGSRVVSSDRYTTSNTTITNRLELQNYVLLLCDRLEALYQDTAIILKTSSDSGIVLSAYGELYFRGAINGLQLLCPDLFFIQVYVPEQMTVEDYDMSLATQYGERLATDDLGKGFTRLGDIIGVSGQIAAALLVFVTTIGLCALAVRKRWDIEIGMAAGCILAIFVSLIMGDIIFTILMLGSLVSIMGIVWLLILKRA